MSASGHDAIGYGLGIWDRLELPDHMEKCESLWWSEDGEWLTGRSISLKLLEYEYQDVMDGSVACIPCLSLARYAW